MFMGSAQKFSRSTMESQKNVRTDSWALHTTALRDEPVESAIFGSGFFAKGKGNAAQHTCYHYASSQKVPARGKFLFLNRPVNSRHGVRHEMSLGIMSPPRAPVNHPETRHPQQDRQCCHPKQCSHHVYTSITGGAARSALFRSAMTATTQPVHVGIISSTGTSFTTKVGSKRT